MSTATPIKVFIVFVSGRKGVGKTTVADMLVRLIKGVPDATFECARLSFASYARASLDKQLVERGTTLDEHDGLGLLLAQPIEAGPSTAYKMYILPAIQDARKNRSTKPLVFVFDDYQCTEELDFLKSQLWGTVDFKPFTVYVHARRRSYQASGNQRCAGDLMRSQLPHNYWECIVQNGGPIHKLLEHVIPLYDKLADRIGIRCTQMLQARAEERDYWAMMHPPVPPAWRAFSRAPTNEYQFNPFADDGLQSLTSRSCSSSTSGDTQMDVDLR